MARSPGSVTMQLLPRRVIGLAALATLLAPLFGCQFLGPSSMQAGRLSYNEVIQRTSKVQVFSNIVRVKNHEPTTFLDVVQINAGVLAQGVAMGGVTNIGLTRPGSANLSLEYQETPTIQYQPLSGAALISQIATPITTDSIANLYNGERPLASLLSFAVERLTPGYTDYASAINALIALDDLGAITITPVLLESSSGTDKKASSSSSKSDDKKQSSVLVITLLPSHPYTRGRLDQAETQRRIQSFWCRLIIVLQGTNVSCGTTRRILFSTTVPPPATVGAPPRSLSFLQTRSALGILKAATETPAPLIGFVPEAKYRVIRDRPWNLEQERKGCAGRLLYLIAGRRKPSRPSHRKSGTLRPDCCLYS